MENTDTTNIPCFSIPSLLNQRRDDKTIPSANQELIALCNSEMDTFRFPCRFDAIIISLCTEGECTIISNLREYTLTKGSMFICGPKKIIQVKSSSQSRADVLVVSPALLGESHINIKNMMPLFIEFGEHPCLPLAEIDIQALHNLIFQIASETQVTTQTIFTPDVIGGLVSAVISKICDIMQRHIQQFSEAQNGHSRNRGEEYFKEFMLLLGQNYKQHRVVSFYAKQMCITPKYLTTLIKRISNKSVSEWIDDYVVLEAKMVLKYSNMSIQEVAYYLNFPNQSFFGSYFKRSTGMSPSQYKLQ